MFTALSLAVVVPLLGRGVLPRGLRGVVRGGVPFVTAWFPPARRGTALGIYGIGTAGTAVAAFTVPRSSPPPPGPSLFPLIAAVIAATAAMLWSVARDAPDWRPQTLPLAARLRAALGLRITLDLAVLYAVTFGGSSPSAPTCRPTCRRPTRLPPRTPEPGATIAGLDGHR